MANILSTHPVLGGLLLLHLSHLLVSQDLSTHPVLGGLLLPTKFQSIVGQGFQVSLARMSPNLLFEPHLQKSYQDEKTMRFRQNKHFGTCADL